VEATAVSMQEMRGDVSRLDSNSETQKKFFDQQLQQVEGLAQSALDNTTGLQHQVDSVRQQTRDLHDSLKSMHRHTDIVTTGFTDMMRGFHNMTFDMPNMFDEWWRIRQGNEGGNPATISGEDMRKQWNFNHSFPSVPPLPQLLELVQNVGPSSSTAGPTEPEPQSDGDDKRSPPSSRPSSAELFKQYVNHPSSSQENLIVVMNGTQGEEEHGEQSSNELPPAQESMAMPQDIEY